MSALARIPQRRQFVGISDKLAAPLTAALRRRIEDAIDALILFLDAADLDPDLEPDEDREDDQDQDASEERHVA